MTGKDWKRIYQANLRASGLEGVRLAVRLNDRRFKSLQKTEYYANCRQDPLGRVVGKLLCFRHTRLCDRYQWTIPINVFVEGLALVHFGTVVVSGSARVERNCCIHVCTNIGGISAKNLWSISDGEMLHSYPGRGNGR